MDYVVGKDSCDYLITIIPPFNKCLTRKSKSPSQIPERAIKVIRLGFEPKTHSLEGCCSIQLSYRTDP